MSRTIGVRAGPKGMIQETAKTMVKTAKMDSNTNDKVKTSIAINTIVSAFMYQDLKMTHNDWAKVNISSMIQEDRDNCDVINITFKEKSDISIVNSHLKNLKHESTHKMYQFVPKNLLNRFKGFESAARKRRIDSGNSLNTKIRRLVNMTLYF